MWALDPTNSPELIDRLRPHGRDRNFEAARVGEGWRSLVEECHGRLAARFPDYELLAIKQKFGVLSYQAFPYRWTEGQSAWTSQERSELGAITGDIQERSEQVCEWCGALGQIREWRTRYIATLCDACDERFPDPPSVMPADEPTLPTGPRRPQTIEGRFGRRCTLRTSAGGTP